MVWKRPDGQKTESGKYLVQILCSPPWWPGMPSVKHLSTVINIYTALYSYLYFVVLYIIFNPGQHQHGCARAEGGEDGESSCAKRWERSVPGIWSQQPKCACASTSRQVCACASTSGWVCACASNLVCACAKWVCACAKWVCADLKYA